MAIVLIILLCACVHLASGQVVNVARGKPTNVSSRFANRDPGLAVDGDTDQSTYKVIVTGVNQQYAAWWVDLQTQVQDPLITIYFRIISENPSPDDARRTSIQVYTSTTPFTSFPPGDKPCYTTDTDYRNVAYVVNFTNCSGTWRYLMVYRQAGDNIVDFGELQVWACDGTYGQNCSKSCSSRQCAVTPTSCDRYTGACPNGRCKAGWMGPDCTVCSTGNYGANCDKSCNDRQCAVTSTTCDRTTGACNPAGCKAGYNGTDCVDECEADRYGANCVNYCSSRNCSAPSAQCNRISGVCPGGCQPGWTGIDCIQVCESGTYGLGCKLCTNRKCKNISSSCDQLTGDCVGGCQAGWNGTDCTQKCEADRYGANCVNYCSSRNCSAPSAQCNRISGVCPGGCQPGWTGIDCIQVCESGTYGLGCKLCTNRKCKNISSSCDQLTGDCVGGCQAGWNGTDCTQKCLSGTYGDNCNKTCSSRNCQNTTSSCNHVTGVCPDGCKTGWNGTDCMTECTPGTYGFNCMKSCSDRHCKNSSSLCARDTGQCPDGCLDGYTGEDCTSRECRDGYNGVECQMELHKSGPLVPAVAGTVAAVLVIAIIVIVIIVWRRRHSTQPNTRLGKRSQGGLNGAQAKKDINNEVGSEYANVVNVDENAATKSKPPKKLKPAKTQPTRENAMQETKPRSSRQPEEPTADPDLDEEIQDEEDFSPSNDYYNVDDTEEVIREIPVSDLEKTIQKIRNRKGGFEAEYNRLPSGFTAPYDDSQKPENSGKNKFRGYYPYDHNRVRLSEIPSIPGSDYINASTMHSYDQSKTYIAAQAPNKKTVGDFWRMIWEQHCSRVVMLTGLVEGGKAKCYQYWPDDGTLDTDQFRVEVEVTDTRANYIVRHLKVTSKDNARRRSVIQYHYISWPDHGVPDTLALIHFIWMIRQMHTQTDRPLLVHCSAGIGRTGTYIAVDSLLDQAQRKGMVDIQGYVSVMREQRKNMIQTKEQYECVFHCLEEMTRFGNTSTDVENFTTSYSNRGMDSVVDRKTIREITQMVLTEVRSDPPARHRMWVNGNEDFIVRVGPTLRQLRGYLQAVTPPPGLDKLLWKLVEENNVHNIIVMSQEDPVGEKGSVKKYGDMVVTTMNQNNLSSDLTMTTVQLQMKGENNSRRIKLYKINVATSLDTISSLLLNHNHLHQLSAETTAVVIIHSESDRKCVVALCIMGNILSGILEDHRVDVIGHVRTFLKCCPDVTFTEEDIEKLYQFAQKCVEITGAANTYANM